MRCAKCGAVNREGRKFCTQCGSPLAAKCSRCGAAIEHAEKFCGECGIALGTPPGDTRKSEEPQIRIAGTPAPENLEGERKTVTVLFADIKGSMDLIENLDPEEARAIVDPALKLMMEAVQRYGGYVAQSTGDGIFALFGAPLAHEDHPQRALYAALRMQEELRRYSDHIRAEGRVPIQARVGVNTGEVVVRSIMTGEGRTEYVPVGHSTGIAARMQALAPVGSIAAPQQTRKLCEGYFVFKGLGPTKVKGVSEPVNVYEVTGLGPLRTRLQRSAGRGLTKFVGREREMEVLVHAGERAKSGHGQIVAVMAEAGTGKSRLLYEFKANSQSEWRVLETLPVSHEKTSALLPVIELLRSYFGIEPNNDLRHRREKVAARIAVLDHTLADTLPYLLGLLGLVEGEDPLADMDPRIRHQRLLEAIKRIMLRESLEHPLLMIFEDLHWIDEDTQAVLNLLTDSIGNSKILMLVTYRPEYSHSWCNKTYYTQLRLDPLGKDSFEDLMSSLLGSGEAPLKGLIFEKSEGNPFFAEEIIEMLLDQGALVRNGHIKLAKPLAQLKIPPTVRDILASRIDRLPPDHKELLQMLAVAGRDFRLSIVREVSKPPDEKLDWILRDLQLAEFIYEQPATGDIEYAFKHALTQEVAYNSILSDKRKTLHERVGVAIETIFADSDDYCSELARHFRLSGNVRKAIEYLTRAGLRARMRSANAEAVEQYVRALEMLTTLAKSRARSQLELALQLGLLAPLGSTKGWGSVEHEQACDRARELCDELDDASQLPHVMSGQVSTFFARADLQRAEKLGLMFLEWAQRTGDRESLIEANHSLISSEFFLGKFQRCVALGDAVEALYDINRDRSHALTYGDDPAVCSMGHKACAQWSLGFPERAVQTLCRAEVIVRELKHPFTEGVYLLRAFMIQDSLRLHDEAYKSLKAMAALCEERGFAEMGVFASAGLADWLIRQGKMSKGIELLKGYAVEFRSLNQYSALTMLLMRLAEVYGENGQVEEALKLLEETQTTIAKTAGRAFEAEVLRLTGEMFFKQSRFVEAGVWFRRAIDVARLQAAKSYELRATASLARSLRDTNRRDEARTMLAEIYNWFTEGFDTADLKDAKALLDELRG